MFNKSIFIFRRDQRLEDNTSLNKALAQSKEVIPVFFLDIRQQSSENNYFSANAFQFMLESLDDLSETLRSKGSKLFIIKGELIYQLKKIIQDQEVDAVYFNYDYTPFSKKRDQEIKDLCSELGVKFLPDHDLGLCKPGEVLKDDGKPYTIYTPFANKARKVTEVRGVEKLRSNNFFSGRIEQAMTKRELEELMDNSSSRRVRGGESEVTKILKSLPGSADYKEDRDYPALDSTTKLSAYLKFGNVSARKVYHLLTAIYTNHFMISELYWRDFFTQISHYFPHVYEGAFNQKYNKVRWSQSKKNFEAWCKGETGFPIVDAGMRELNSTGYMHNRVRMIVASFLTKDLQINWQWGEKYFASQLTDYDPALNNGNWQWAASTGCDAQPYFRIFNPWSQQKKFDKDSAYIRKWIPELEKVDDKKINKEEYYYENKIAGYPSPIVLHSEAREKTLDMFKAIK